MKKVELLDGEKGKFINYLENNYKNQDQSLNNFLEHFLIKIKKENNKIVSNIYPGYEKYKWIFEGDEFIIEYKEEGDPVHNIISSDAIYFKRLYVYHNDLEKIQNFLLHAYKEKDNIKSDKITIYSSRSNKYSTWEKHESISVQTLDNIYIDKTIKENLISHIDNFLGLKEKYLKYGRNHKLNLLLTGVPGSGKTCLCKALAKKYNYPVYIFNFSKSLTDESFIELINDIKENSIVLFEDIDSYFKDRTSLDINISFSCLINILDGFISKSGIGIITILTANNPDRLDPALIRPGRIDKIIKFDYPKKDEIKEAFMSLIPSKKDIDFEEFYDKIKNVKCNMSGFVDYLFRNPDTYLENIEELIKQNKLMNDIINDNSYKLYN